LHIPYNLQGVKNYEYNGMMDTLIIKFSKFMSTL